MPVSVAAAHRGAPVEGMSVHVKLLNLIITIRQRYIGIVTDCQVVERPARSSAQGEPAIASG
jgi:hypothetical protein